MIRRTRMAPIQLPDACMQLVPDLFGVTRKEGKTTLVCASSREEALGKYNDMVSRNPQLGWPSEPPDSVCTVQAVK